MKSENLRLPLGETSDKGWFLGVDVIEDLSSRVYNPDILVEDKMRFFLADENARVDRDILEGHIYLSLRISQTVLREALDFGLKRMWEGFEMSGLALTHINEVTMYPASQINSPMQPEYDLTYVAKETESELQRYVAALETD